MNGKPNHKTDVKDASALIGYALSLSKLAMYSEAIEFLIAHENVCKDVPDYYLILATAYRKQFNYTQAKKYIDLAVQKDAKNEKIQQELNLINKWDANLRKSQVKEYQSYELVCDKDYFKKRHNQTNNTYRVLSIDGGGIRGIIPAVWICEIERRAKRPISHLFNLVAGTSTGGIIAAGLSAPKNSDGFTPRYRAYDLLDIYLHQGKDIFTRNNRLHTLLFKTRYSDKGRKNKFNERFDTLRLADSLTELVIPACAEKNLVATYLFNRNDGQNDSCRNQTYTDALMATSAAPTYFPTYEIEGKGLFNDGGVHVNNPTSVACSEAIRYGVDGQKLYVLSLGTGSLAYSTVHESDNRGLLFWGIHLNDVALQAQIGNTDKTLHYALDNYKRWQVWLEKSIRLDSVKEKDLNQLVEYACQFIEENDKEFNEVVDFLLKD